MKKKTISKSILTTALCAVMTLATISTTWAGNIYGDDGSHIKIMTTAGEFSSLPKTNIKGANIYVLPADAKIWVAREGSTANPSTVDFYVRVCPMNLLAEIENVTDTRWYPEEIFSENLQFDKQYLVSSEYYGINDGIYMAIFEDTADSSFQRFFYVLDNGSYPTVSTEPTTGWKQDNTGWWYQNMDGSYPKSTWQQIDGKYYYFNELGYMLSNTTTPDGYQVDASGARIHSEPITRTNASVDPANLPPHGDPIYKSYPTNDGPEEGPFGNISGYIYVPGYGYILDNGGGAIITGYAPEPDVCAGGTRPCEGHIGSMG